MSDWADEKAKRILFNDYVKTNQIAQALREARAEGMREMSVVGCRGKKRVCCSSCADNLDAKCSGEEANAKTKP